MRIVLGILIASLVPLQADEEPDNVLLHQERWGGRGLGPKENVIRRFHVDRAELEKVRAWRPGDGKPPLTRDEAVAIAKRSARADGVKEALLETLRVTLMPQQAYDENVHRLPDTVCKWFFVVRFSLDDSEVNIQDVPMYLITMSGAVARSTVGPMK